MKKWLKRLAIALVALLLLAAVALWWLLGTGSGLRFALARASGFTDGALSVQQADGRLLGPLRLRGIRYAGKDGLRATVGSASLDLRFWPLLARRVHVLDLAVEDVVVALPKAPPQPEEQNGPFSLKPPVDLLLDRVHVGKVAIRQDGQPLFASDSLDLAGRWTAAGIALKQLRLRAPDGSADLAGEVALDRGYRGDGNARFAWKLAGTGYAGTLAAHGDGKRSHLQLDLSAPTPAQLVLDLAQDDRYAWTATLKAPRFDPKPLLGESSLTALAVDLRGSGDRRGGTLQGRLALNDYQLQLQPLRAHFSDDYKTLQLDALTLGSPQVKGRVNASGTLHLDAQLLGGALRLAWQDVQLPPELAGQALASHGQLDASGNADRFHAAGDVAIGPPGKLAQLTLDLDGTPQRIALNALALKQPQGGLDLKGELVLQPALAWQLDAKARAFDPGQLFAGWNGAIDADLGTRGSLPQSGPDATLELRRLDGRLRERALRGSGTLHLSPARVVDGRLELASGGSTIRLDARPGASNDVQLRLAVASLADWLPDAAGRLQGDFRLKGLWPRLAVDGRLDGQTLSYHGQTVDGLHLTAHLPDLSAPGGQLDLVATGTHAGGLAFQRIALDGDGTQARHQLKLDAQGSQLSLHLALAGGMQGQAWNGTLSALDLEPQGLPRWRLQQPARLRWNDGAASLSELCLSAGDPLLCVSATQDKAGNLDAGYRLRALPLALLLNASGNAELPLRVDGTLQGDGRIRRNAAGALSGSATLGSAQGSVTYTDHAEAPLLTWRGLAVDAQLGPDRQQATLRAELDHGGRIDGQFAVGGAQRALSGQLTLHVGSLAALELFTSELANVKGSLDGSFRFGGTLDKPQLTGQASVAGFAGEVPSLGLKLGEGRLVAGTQGAQQLVLDGSVHSGRGQLAVGGTVGLGEGAATAVTLKGKQFTAADIPAAKVEISPDLVVRQDAKGINVGGSVLLDSADVNVEKLPGAGATQASPDVVVVDQQKQEEAAKQLPLNAQVKVDLGRRTHLIGFGLDGRLSGTLTVSERPGRDTTGQGQVAVDGTYKAYGQDLHIERGQLLFASTPIDNPGLNIRAVRKLNPNATIDEGQEVGLLVSGTAQRPVLTVFSNPVMEQSDALSYLITGKPLSQVKGGEGNMVGAAAQALGSAAGDLLAKSIGSKIGVDEIGVSSNEALGGSSAFTVGKYLSPRLYLSYGVGLFEPGEVITLRYRLSRRWNFEAQNATEFSRASLNYRIER